MTGLIEILTQFIMAHGALGVFLASVLEEVIVPIPSTLIQTGAGFLFLSGQAVTAHTIWILLAHIVLPAAVGVTVGSLLIYGLVWWGGMPFVHRFGKFFFLTPAKVEHAKEYVLSHRSIIWAFCGIRFIPILPSVFVAAGAGLIRLPIRIYLWTTFVGVAVRATYLGFAGWLTGQALESLSPNHSAIGTVILFTIALGIVTGLVGVLVFYAKRRRQKQNTKI